jgi:uncharacterized protein (TIGR01777 family)
MIIAVTGSSGLVGSALVAALEADGQLVRRVVRRSSPPRSGEGFGEGYEIRWDPAGGTIDATHFNDVDAVVHLAGENLAARRWSASFKAKIRDSRLGGTQLLCRTLASLASKPSVLVSASAVGYYGDRGDEPLDESSPPGHGFLAQLCQQWEDATHPARDANIRVVNLRIGLVLSRRGGVLAKMLTPFRMGIGGVLGSGRQYISWITLDDLVRVIRFALESAALHGPVNAVAPGAVTNREFTTTLGRALGRPTVLRMPAFAARLAFGEMADEALLVGARVKPRALSAAGFTFEHPQFAEALRHALA